MVLNLNSLFQKDHSKLMVNSCGKLPGCLDVCVVGVEDEVIRASTQGKFNKR